MLNSLKQELEKEETGSSINAELASVNAMGKEGLPEEKLLEKLFKYHRADNCESLTKGPVNQSICDHLTPAVQFQDIRVLQKVQTAIFKGMCALTTMTEIVRDIRHLSSNKCVR